MQDFLVAALSVIVPGAALLALLSRLVWGKSVVVGNTISIPIIRNGIVGMRMVSRYSFPAHSGPVQAVAWSPNGAYLAASEGKQVRVWHMGVGRAMFSYTGHTGEVRALAWSPSKPFLLVSSGSDRSVHLWRFRPFAMDLQSFRCTLETEPLCVAWAPAKNVFACAGNLWITLFAGEWPYIDSGAFGTAHPTPVQFVAWSPDERYLASAGYDGIVYLWDVGCGTAMLCYHAFDCEVTSLSFSPDSSRLAVAYTGGVVRVWQVQPLPDLSEAHFVGSLPVILAPRLAYREHTGKVSAAVWSPDGRKIASGGSDGILRIWDASTGSTLLTYAARSPINALSWSPNGKRLALGVQSLPLQVLRLS